MTVEKRLKSILELYGIKAENSNIVPFGTGLVNNTWKISSSSRTYILQRINQDVFKNPLDIALNIRQIGNYLSQNNPEYLFVNPETTLSGKDLVFNTEYGYFRLFPFVAGSHTSDVLSSIHQAFEAAKEFGKFTKILSEFPAQRLKITIPNFHNLPLRYQQFELALINGNQKKIKEGHEYIKFLKKNFEIVSISEKITRHPSFKKRVTHHDTKVSNILFNEKNRPLCVIDLDTVMPGYFISDVGDMFRTYLSPVSEEEKDFEKIQIRNDYFKAISEGYLSEMNTELTNLEKEHFLYAGKFMIYMQSLRFITDFLTGDGYYGAKYEGHNLVRAGNQITLLQRLMAKENDLVKRV